MAVATELISQISPLIEEAGFRLWDLKLTKAGKRSVVSVFIDKTGGPTLDDIADISRTIAPVLDEHRSLENAYHLEVASPGLERSLTKPEHYIWSIGTEVAVSHRQDGTLVRSRGKILKADLEKITLETEQEELTIVFEAITKAHTIFDFNKAMKTDSVNSGIDNAEQGDTDE